MGYLLTNIAARIEEILSMRLLGIKRLGVESLGKAKKKKSSWTESNKTKQISMCIAR